MALYIYSKGERKMTGCIVVMRDGQEFEFDDAHFNADNNGVTVRRDKDNAVLAYWYAEGVAGVYGLGEGVNE